VSFVRKALPVSFVVSEQGGACQSTYRCFSSCGGRFINALLIAGSSEWFDGSPSRKKHSLLDLNSSCPRKSSGRSIFLGDGGGHYEGTKTVSHGSLLLSLRLV
jgi:hypothetical protein